MSSDHPIRWLAGAAAVVGAFVALAVCSSGPPKVLELKVEAHRVVFAENHQQAIAMASVPVAARQVASKPLPMRKQKLAQNQLPEIPRRGSVIAVAAAATTSAFHGGFAFVRLPAKVDVQQPKPLAVMGAQVTDSPRTDVLFAARPLRGPPSARLG